MKRPVVLSIAGSDPGGGAGIQQDLRVFTVLGVYGCAAITALTVQDTTGVKAVHPVSGDVLRAQVRTVMEDIHPTVVKTGMLSSLENVKVLSEVMAGYPDVFIVADPVMLSKNGKSLLDEDAICLYMDEFLPLVDLVTPNIPECVRFTGIPMDAPEFLEKAPEKFCSLMEKARPAEKKGPSVLLKGGHGHPSMVCTDVLYHEGRFHMYEFPRQTNPHTHGTGCVLSSALAGFLARGEAVAAAVEKARNVVFEAIKAGFPLGSGIGPVDPLVLLKQDVI